MLSTVLILAFAASLIYFYFASKYNYWKRKGIVSPKPLPIVGNIAESLLMKESIGQLYTKIYEQYRGHPYVGIYNFSTPNILIRDADVVKDILNKEFGKFHDNNFKLDEKTDPVVSKNPFFLRGNEWKTARNLLTPCFTSGKVKLVLSTLNDSGNKMAKYIEREMKLNGKVPFDAKELSAKFTTENIASCVYGVEGKCFDDMNAEFRQFGRDILDISVLKAIRMLLILVFPFMAKILTVSFLPKKVENRLRTIVQDILQHRKENGITRNDFLDFLSANKEKSVHQNYTYEDVLAHSITFYLDGFETSSIALSYVLYELAANRDVQDKLKEEIDEVLRKHDNNITHEALQDLEYLDCVINESLRLHSPVLWMEKVCTEDYTLTSNNGSSVTIEKGTPTIIPVHALQTDDRYFENAQVFNPDRFTKENKGNISKDVLLYFGSGPRSCLGKRFALQQVKIGVVHLVKDFIMEVDKKTKVPLEIDPLYFLMSAKGGLWLNFTKRD